MGKGTAPRAVFRKKGLMDRKQKKRLIKTVLLAVCAASFILGAIQIRHHVYSKKALVRCAISRAQSEAVRAAQNIEGRLKEIQSSAGSIADDLSRGALDETALKERLKDAVTSHPDLLEMGVAYIPFGHSAKQKLCAPHFGRMDGKLEFFQVENFYDYTQADWYGHAVSKGGGWVEPDFGKATKKLMAAYAVPFYREEGPARRKVVAGVVRAAVSLDTLREIVQAEDLGKAGYGFLLSPKGIFLEYPIREVVEKQRNIFDVITEFKDRNFERIRSATQKAVCGEASSATLPDPESGETFWLFYQPIPSSGWSLGAVFVEREIFSDVRTFRTQLTGIVLQIIVFLSALCALLSGAYRMRVAGLWTTSSVFSVLCIAGTCYLWYLALALPAEDSQNNWMLADKKSLHKFIQAQVKTCAQLHKAPPVFIPTGIQIQSLEFTGSNDVWMSGYVWQKYAQGMHDGIARGFVMPEAKEVRVTEAYRFQEGNSEVIGWYFEAAIREFFDYSKYPFDRPDIWVWLRPKDFGKNVFLVPDLNAYKILTPAALPGLQKNLVLPGYVFLRTYFDCRSQVCGTDYGIGGAQRMDKFPELYFNILVRRNFLTPFVSKIFPLLIMVSMLFIVLMTFTKDDSMRKSFGLSGLGVLGVVISFFFATLLAQINLRQELDADGFIFLENFHFITYFILLWLGINAFLFTGEKHIRWVQYEHGLAMKLIYWPLFTVLVFAITCACFY